MSHVHNIAGQSNAAAEYQAYLEALRAARQARENDRPDGVGQARTFDSAIDTELDGDEEQPEDQAPEAQDAPAAGTAEEGALDSEGAPHEGLGKHYA
jgi:hypothetical protein